MEKRRFTDSIFDAAYRLHRGSHGVNLSCNLRVLARETRVRPEAERRNDAQHCCVDDVRKRLQTQRPEHAGGQVQHHDDGDQDDGRPQAGEDVLCLVVAQEVVEVAVDLGLELREVLAAEFFAAHLARRQEQMLCRLATSVVLAAQHRRHQVRLVAATNLATRVSK